MSHFWKIVDNRIVLETESGTFIPSAEDILKFSSGDHTDAPAWALPYLESFHEDLNIKFSRFGATLSMEVVPQGESIMLLARAKKGMRDKVIPFDIGSPPDSVVIDGEWAFFVNDVSSIAQSLLNAGIASTGIISFAQYVNLVSSKEEAAADVRKLTKAEILDISAENPIRANVNAILRPYQQVGFKWLNFIVSSGLGCILADGMGLGKTLQIIALIESRRRNVSEPSLVIAPVSLLENWRRELCKFTPRINCIVHHGCNRLRFVSDFESYDVVITGYETATNDLGLLGSVNWDIVILDEAQAIKNPSSKRTQAVKKLNRRSGIAVSGTPFESHLSNLWSIVDFAIPGYLGSFKSFVGNFNDDVDGAAEVEPLITPVMLRRTLSDVDLQLPPRIDSSVILMMTNEEANAYEATRLAIVDSVNNGHAITLALLTKLRMFCAHPFLLDKTMIGKADPYPPSAKYQHLCQILLDVISNGEKAIIVTSYLGMFDIFKYDLPRRFGIDVYMINGGVKPRDRQAIVDEFSAVEGAAVLITNAATGGAGLNITAASHVIHYNLEWNPADIDQASARAHRFGQSNTVFIYELSYSNTVEQHIVDIIQKKRSMEELAVVGVDGVEFNADEIIAAIHLSPV